MFCAQPELLTVQTETLLITLPQENSKIPKRTHQTNTATDNGRQMT